RCRTDRRHRTQRGCRGRLLHRARSTHSIALRFVAHTPTWSRALDIVATSRAGVVLRRWRLLAAGGVAADARPRSGVLRRCERLAVVTRLLPCDALVVLARLAGILRRDRDLLADGEQACLNIHYMCAARAADK